ncbi:uncharacterized protein C8Q71DRAFT_721377 [Rhodofomes roseus]|uniref:Uncharacterized protein n=1 Tax=Rhodofomes roseus TaxID=34475 RepID=A0ABQ8KR88_9APHY|nr:uncharacterized protein C8Q71DRAFT_721377 [Rhodofomes roseus]KAH9840943.1 hypothetical protein C8Q71DRAFT_721377 [Rhodofomes roseus]
MSHVELKPLVFIASGFYIRTRGMSASPSDFWVPCVIAIIEHRARKYSLYIVDGFVRGRSFVSPFKVSWKSVTVQDSAVLAWWDGTYLHQFVLGGSNDPTVTFVGLAQAFMTGMHFAHQARKALEERLMACFQAVPSSLPSQSGQFFLTLARLIAELNQQMDVDDD